MAFLKRLSDNIWSFVSPSKSNNDPMPTPQTDPVFKKPGEPASHARVRKLSYQTRSMSPRERVGAWRDTSSVDEVKSPLAGRKRPRPATPSSSGAGRRSKTPRMDNDEMDHDVDGDVDTDTLMDDQDEDGSPLAFRRYSTPGIRPLSSSPSRGFDSDDSLSVDNTLIVGERDETPTKSKLVSLPDEHRMRGISTDELREKGWDDDYITLIQTIAMRGHQPLLPAYMKFEYNFMPDALFESTDDAFVASVRNDHFKASKAFEHLLELGSRVRDRVYLRSHVNPEMQIRKQLKSYLSWALEDAGIDRESYIPILAIESKPGGTEAAELRLNATRKCRRLAAKYKHALQVQRSIEISPASRASDGTLLSYPLPTFYAIVASHAIVAIMAYKPDAPDPECTSMALFDFKERDYDVWNSLALAILVCHVRNIQMRIAEETNIGMKQTGYSDEEMAEDDPDA